MITKLEAKAEIISSMQQHTIDVLVNTLAEARVEIEQLKARLQACEPPLETPKTP